ncbi:MAG: tetratricopeptide repeat protein [Deltaproteobacteria bacterium]|nr:tetratricopeptide repeat protein [Deltaproteobacteria bacterium]MDQ3300113.1 tetratricopeptide repeat protein [Myxococcota bacterium]
MVDPDRRPTAQEIEELIDLVRRDPGSPAFIDLGEAYLSLGRPRDSAQVCNVGLAASPDSLEGRVMLARAYAALHQWKEAQGELLRVVKVDRSNRQGFALLGEVLLRRADHERAVPVLQHAQNLDPTSPQILTMLRRARAGQPLDPPPPIPMPVPPRGETDNGSEIQHSRARSASRPPPPRPMGPGPMVPTSSPQMPTMAIQPAAYDQRGYPDPAAAAPPPPAQRMPKQTAPPPMSVEGIRPRIAGQKQHNAAAASLRQSAAVGETYLNDLLTGGLLDVAGVRVPDEIFDLRPDRRWGRSTRRAFIFLFVVLVVGIGGGGTWYWWEQKEKGAAIAGLQKQAKEVLGEATFVGLSESLDKLNAAQKKEKSSLTYAFSVEIGGLAALLYGTPTEEVDSAYKSAVKDIEPGEPGSRELLIGKAAMELARLHQLEPRNAATTLADITKKLDDHLATQGDDQWARWLRGRASLAAGERNAARAAFKTAGDGETGIAVALIDLADLTVDDGKLEEALAIYKQATQKSKDHPLAVLGRALGRAEASFETDEAIGELNDKFVVTKLPPRVSAYRWLALALANISIEDYPRALEAVKKATAGSPPGEPRFWARVAWVHYALGDLASTATARGKCVWYSTKPEDDPPVQLVDAGLLLASGLPEKALDLANKIDGVRPRIIRTYALLDLGKPKEALVEIEEVIKTAQQNVEAQILREQARMLAATDKTRLEPTEALERLARRTSSKLGRHALGVAWLALGDIAKAKEPLTAAVTDVSETQPNPLMYRTRTALAEIALAENDIAGAGKQLDLALDANSGYFPTRAMQARVVLRNKEPDKALVFLEPILKESAAVTPSVQLTFAEAIITRKGATAKDKEQAKAILVALKGKPGVPSGELVRIANLIDDDLAEELGLEEAPAEAPKPPPKKPSRRRRGR